MNKPTDEVKSNLDKLASYFIRMDEKKQNDFLNWSSGLVAGVEMMIGTLPGDEYAAESDKNSKHENTET